MVWVIVFIASWILFFLLARNNHSKLAYVAGIIAVFFQLLIDVNANYIGLYHIHDSPITFMGSSVFFTLGPVFVMGVLFVQYMPRNKWLQVAHIVIFVSLFMIFEVIVEWIGVLEYVHWNHLGSLSVDINVFMALSWFACIFVHRYQQE